MIFLVSSYERDVSVMSRVQHLKTEEMFSIFSRSSRSLYGRKNK